MSRAIPSLLLSTVLCSLQAQAAITFIPHVSGGEKRDWAFEFGVAYITENGVDDLLSGDASLGRGPAGGEIYAFTASRRLGELEWTVGNWTFRPQLELPVTLELVDENGRDPFLDINVSFNVRWVDFPWNEFVSTTFSMGVGLSYSHNVYLMDIERYPNEDRSHLKFNWPIALTFAHPEHPEHQAMVFLLHQSGGRIFDTGGVNSLGFGYRFDF
jgi:hypothetical protein